MKLHHSLLLFAFAVCSLQAMDKSKYSMIEKLKTYSYSIYYHVYPKNVSAEMFAICRLTERNGEYTYAMPGSLPKPAKEIKDIFDEVHNEYELRQSRRASS